jgi:DNA-binding PadR family transcriptional regulator
VGIASRIHQITQSAIQVSFGSLFPALHRMEKKGWLLAEWRTSELNRRAKYYALTKSGRKQLRDEQHQWSLVVKALSTALRST